VKTRTQAKPGTQAVTIINNEGLPRVAFVCGDNILSILYINENLTSRLEHPSPQERLGIGPADAAYADCRPLRPVQFNVGEEARIYVKRQGTDRFQGIGDICGTIVDVEDGGSLYSKLKQDQNATSIKRRHVSRH